MKRLLTLLIFCLFRGPIALCMFEELSEALNEEMQTQRIKKHYRDQKLILAAQKGQNELIRELLVDGADIEAHDFHGHRPLHTAARFNQVHAINELLDRGALLEGQGSGGETPLHGAASCNHEPACGYLLARGASKEARDRNGSTPLHYAAANNSVEVIRLLKACGADVNALNKRRMTPLHWAVISHESFRNNCLDAIKCLIELGADLEAQNVNNENALKLAFDPARKALLEGYYRELAKRRFWAYVSLKKQALFPYLVLPREICRFIAKKVTL